MKLSLKKKVLFNTLLTGVLWLIAGIAGLLTKFSKYWGIVAAVCLFACVFLLFFTNFFAVDEGDEMSEYNFLRAKERALDITIIGLALWLIVTSITDIFDIQLDVNFKAWILMFLGGIHFIMGFYFIRYEKGK